MAKEIPYFKFYIGDWSNGDITLETFELQGIFINICAYYWSKDCDVTLDNVKKKFRSVADGIDELINCNCIKIIGNNISISFLNEQMQSKEVQKAINRNNGSLGGRPRKEITEEKPNGLFLQNPNITNIKKSKEEKIREEVSKDTIVELSTPTSTDGALSSKEKCRLFIEKFNSLRKTRTGKKSTYTVTDATCSALNARLKKYASKDLIVVLNRAIRDEYHISTQNQYLTPEYILREKIVERYLNQ